MLTKMAVLTDFDGTVTKKDVGHSLTTRYASKERALVEERWKKGLIGSAQSHKEQYSSMEVPEDIIKAYILEMEIDKTFLPFKEYLEEKGIPLAIVSDGFDFYIKPLLEKYRISIPCYSNSLHYQEKRFSFPYQHESCWRCAHCKAGTVQRHLKRGERVFYIGDGRSDFYGAQIADVIFARRGKNLEKLLLRQGIHSFISFDTFQDILTYFLEGDFTFRYQEVSYRECAFLHDDRLLDLQT